MKLKNCNQDKFSNSTLYQVCFSPFPKSKKPLTFPPNLGSCLFHLCEQATLVQGKLSTWRYGPCLGRSSRILVASFFPILFPIGPFPLASLPVPRLSHPVASFNPGLTYFLLLRMVMMMAWRPRRKQPRAKEGVRSREGRVAPLGVPKSGNDHQ